MNVGVGPVGGTAPPALATNIHQAYLDLYGDPAWDQFGGNYVNLYHEYMVAGLAPATLRDTLYHSGNAGTPIHILAHVRDPAAAPEDPGYIIGYHRLSRHVASFGQEGRPFDGQGHAFMGDVVNGQVPTSVAIPDQVFNLLHPVQVPTPGRLEQLLQADPDAQAVGRSVRCGRS